MGGSKNKEKHEGILAFIGTELRAREEKLEEQGATAEMAALRARENVDLRKKIRQYMSKHYLRCDRDMITFKEFLEIEWDDEYPALVYDFLYYMFGFRVRAKRNKHEYYSRLDRNFFNVTSNSSFFGGASDVFVTQTDSLLNL